MDKEQKIIDLIMKMIEQSNQRMERLSKRNEYGHSDLSKNTLKASQLEQKEFEMQMKLLDKVVKNWKKGEGFIDITPEALKKREG